MRDLNLNELELVYGAGCKSRSSWKRRCGYGNSPTPPSCGSKTKKSKKCKSKKSKKSKGSKGSKRSRC